MHTGAKVTGLAKASFAISNVTYMKFLQVGKLTSYTGGNKGNEHFGLGYIKKKAASKGDTVVVGGNVSGTVVDVPYLARQHPLVLSSKQ